MIDLPELGVNMILMMSYIHIYFDGAKLALKIMKYGHTEFIFCSLIYIYVGWTGSLY